MKIGKRIIGIILTLALILQCGQGIVIGKAQAVTVGEFGFNNPNLKVVSLDCEKNANGKYEYTIEIHNSGAETISSYGYRISYGNSWDKKEIFLDGNLPIEANHTVIITTPQIDFNGQPPTYACGVYERVKDSRISNVNYAKNQWGNASLSFSVTDTTIKKFLYRFTFLDNDGNVTPFEGSASSLNVSNITLTSPLNWGTLLSYEIVKTYGDASYTAAPSVLTVSPANPPVIDTTTWGGPFITTNASGFSGSGLLKYKVSYDDASGASQTVTFNAPYSSSNAKVKMSNASWYNNNIIITKWEITELVVLSSSYSWMSLSLSDDGNSWIVTNTSDNNVTAITVNDVRYEEALGKNVASTPRPLPAANANHIVEVKLTKAEYVSIAAMYPDASAIWFVPTGATMQETEAGKYQINYTLVNTSTDYRVNSCSLSLHYKINGVDKWDTIIISNPIEAQGSLADVYNIVGDTGSFEFLSLNIQNVNYTKDVDPALEHSALSGPTMATSQLNYKTYVTWSLVTFGTYALEADGSRGPIEWRVLEYDAAQDKIVLMANKALFSMAYEPSMFGATWETSALRTYLNGDFYKDAFNEAEQSAICWVGLDNSGAGSSHSLGGVNTTDRVYVLSVAQINDAKYGLYGGDSSNSVIETRQFEATNATLTNSNLTKKKYAGQTYVNYFLRTPGYYQYDVAGVAPSGFISTSGWRTYTKTAAVCPVVTLDYGNAVAAGLTWKGSIYKQVPAGYNTAAAKSVKATPTKKLKALSVGDAKMVNNVTYEVTETTNKKKTVAVTGVKKSAKKVVIPSTIKVNGATYKVTKIKANAFKSAKKKLRSITIKSKYIKSMNKKAFTGLTDKTTIKISKKQYKKYKKLIKNKKVTIKKL